jgi:class 3 adenylate cyclase/tetratricopeptide (TPR) repeat protein
MEEPAAARDRRKTVTVVFTDVIDSTPLGERFDPETYRRVISRYFIEVSRVLEHHGGTVEKFIGDAVMAAFGIPVIHEDDALRAVRAAGEMREALAALNENLRAEYGIEIGTRTGINTGEVIAGDPSGGHAFVTGDAVVIAQRLEAAASPGEILIGDATHRLVRNAVLTEPLDPLALKGKSQPVRAWRLLGVVAGAPAVARRLDAPMVGRENELSQLRAAFEQTVRDQTARLVTVLGPAGIGKSRLAKELVAEIRDEAKVLIGRCLPYGEGITYWPLRDIVRDVAGGLRRSGLDELLAGEPDGERIAGQVATAVGIGDGSAAPEETMWAVRRLFEHLARQRPLIVGFDDLQWAEPTFVELIEYLLGWSREAPILILGLARPELLDRHPTWHSLGESIMLAPLSSLEAEELLGNLRGETEVDATLLNRITAAAEGNPLYVEQLLAMIAENGAATGDLAIPPSIHALLAARLDRLPPDERAVIEGAAVIGKEFWRGAIGELVSNVEGGAVGASLMTLARKEFIEPARSIFPNEDGFRFRHILIRDAAYLGVPKETRADLHERFGGWLERNEQAGELDEIIGYHLEQAYRYREEIGPVGAGSHSLAIRAGERLAAAGRRALHARADTSAAAALLFRASALVPADYADRPALLAELASALMMGGDFERASDVLADALEIAVTAGDTRVEARVLIDREFHKIYAGSEEASLTIPDVLARAMPALEAAGDNLGLARAWRLRGEVAVLGGHWGERTEALERALEHARLAGDEWEQVTLVGGLVMALYFGPTPVEDAIARCRAFLAEVSGEGAIEAVIWSGLAGLLAMRGDFDEARKLWASAGARFDELGLGYRRAVRCTIGADIETLAGDPDAAEGELRRGYETLERMGEKGARAVVAAYLADTLCRAGRDDEAANYAEIVAELAAGDDVVPQALCRCVRAKLFARRGEADRAEEVAREATVMVERMDFPDLQALTLLSLAEVLDAVGKGAESAEIVERAQALYERKGNVAAGRRMVSEIKTKGRSQ